MAEPLAAEILRRNQALLNSIATADWAAYQDLCDPTLTAFEPEACGQLVEGLDFHHFYFGLGDLKGNHHTTMCSPMVRVMGEVAVIAYVRLSQRVTGNGVPVTSAFEETRVWQRRDGQWKHVHFHRSAIPYGAVQE